MKEFVVINTIFKPWINGHATDKFGTNNAGDSANNEFMAHESMNITVKVKIVESPVVLVDIQGKVYGVLQIDRPSPFCPIS